MFYFSFDFPNGKKQPFAEVLQNCCFQKFRKIHCKTSAHLKLMTLQGNNSETKEFKM